ncbi:peptidoglycan-binding domain-containing protein [Brucella anthropi]|uniref:peptidoglycan-binding domain-containing protein n=1 Tax=Brucella anthropi TaxID=529 RepID=UPI00124D35EF|nr:peptidoglycan-binding domain-containing protein [Brucella anthropi]KAB2777246.1 peptidoglycan-binding protein [Brucella anthropi]
MRKPAKRRSLGSRLLHFFFTSASALAIAAGDFIVRNPVLTGGATAFLVVMSFVSANALWYQPEAHKAVFFSTRPDFVFKPTPRAVLPGTAAAGDNAPKPTETASAEPASSAHNETAQPLEAASLSADRLNMSASVDDMLPALAPNADLEIARLQQRLSTLGIYKGPVDGFTGPQTREAVERWRALQQKLGVQEANIPAQLQADAQNSAPAQDDVAKVIEVAVPTPRPQPAVLKTETVSKPKPALASYEKPAPKKQVAATPAVQSVKVSSQDIIRVQAGLKAFGNDTVPVNGQPGKTTQEAVREFQKLFSMPVTGEIDATLITKMREIGLIS